MLIPRTRHALAVLAISALSALGVMGPAVAPAQPIAQASCTNAYTPGATKCLAAGEFCSHKPGYAAAYANAGFRCKRNGHLTYR
jgi:hypothetical protein